MAVDDLQTFLQERAIVFDETLDVTSGSPFDVQVIQPVLRRLGTDPFTVDFFTFAQERLNQDFPDLATKEGDAITDLLIKTVSLLWDPILRENVRVRNNLSFRDSTILTTDEADALGANLFSERNQGTFAKGPVRIYFAQPQSISIGPANYITSSEGLHFFPSEIQSIRVDEMLFNQEGTLYYFDINTVAENPGDEYNIGPDDVVTIANVEPAVRITNKRRFRFGNPAETAVEFVDRAQQELSERSLVTLRGITAKVTNNFPDVSRLAVVGFNDPEMQRDVLTGGGLGPVRLFGFSAVAVPDGENQLLTRRVNVSGSFDFTTLLGPAGTSTTSWYLTLVDAFGASEVRIQDMQIARLVSASVVDLVDQRIVQSGGTWAWMLRKKELTLSGIPGGILFPDNANGSVAIPDGQVHIGGATDIHVRGVDFDTSSLVISAVVDDTPLASGTQLQIVTASAGSPTVELLDLTLGAGGNYSVGDATYVALQKAALFGYSLQIMEGPAVGSYRVISVDQEIGFSPAVLVDPLPLSVLSTNFRWRILDEIDVDLVEPKETRVIGTDLKTTQGIDYIETAAGTDFDDLGVSANDVLRILNGPDAGDYKVLAVLAPFFDRIQVDRKFGFSRSNLSYQVFRANANGGTILPFIRITSIDLLDTAGQPVGSTIPYAKPVDIRSRAFANSARGVKVDVRDARLGLVGIPLDPSGTNLNTLQFSINAPSFSVPVTVTFGSGLLSLGQIVNAIDTAVGRSVAFIVEGTRIGITPIDGLTTISPGLPDAMATLFGTTDSMSSRDIRSDSTVWASLNPPLEIDLDVLQVLDGFQIGFYDHPVLNGGSGNAVLTDRDFAPEANRHIQLGSRSLGSARLFFLEPTSVEFDTDARLEVALTQGGTVAFKTDPTLNAQRIPALPSSDTPEDGSTTSGGTVLTTASLDFIKKAIHAGDLLEITTVPIRGSTPVDDPIPLLALRTLVLSVGGGSDKVITFINDSTSIATTDVTQAGVASQINRAVGQTICSIVTVGSLKYLEFEADIDIIIRKRGTANAATGGFPGLGFSSASDTNNDSPHRGSYVVTLVSSTTLTVSASNPFPTTMVTPIIRQMFKVFRPGAQRISSTEMANNKTDAGLYYFDLELVSEGSGDLWNLAADLQMTATGYISDGYYLTTDDPNLSFSVVERLRMVLSRSILEVGVSDDPENATQLSGQNLQVNYERSSIAGSVNNFVFAETERVVNESPLARHLIPYFVRFDLTYVGGSAASVVTPDITTYIQELYPADSLKVSDLEKIVSNRGATGITNPLNLIAVIHNTDRTVSVERSQDRLNTGRLAAFIPDILNITRRVS